MVALDIQYTEEELTPKGSNFYCGDGGVKCLIVSNEIAESRYATAEKPKPKVLKVHYHVASGQYKGAANAIEFDLWDNEKIHFKNGGSAAASLLAGQNLRKLSLACGFTETVKDSDLLNNKFVIINHDIEKGQAIEVTDEYGQKKPQLNAAGEPEYYPDRSDVTRRGDKFLKVPEITSEAIQQIAAPITQPQPQQPVQQVAAVAPPVVAAAPAALPPSVATDSVMGAPVQQHAPTAAAIAATPQGDVPF